MDEIVDRICKGIRDEVFAAEARAVAADRVAALRQIASFCEALAVEIEDDE